MIMVYVVLALLTVAVCVIFAMVGELAVRVMRESGIGPDTGRPPSPTAEELSTIATGHIVSALPDAITLQAPAAIDQGDYGLLVLSTICTSCESFARTWVASPQANKLPSPLTVIITARTRQDAISFAASTGLDRLASVDLRFDEVGRWCRAELELSSSPSFVRIIGNKVRRGWLITSFTSIPHLWPIDSPNDHSSKVSNTP